MVKKKLVKRLIQRKSLFSSIQLVPPYLFFLSVFFFFTDTDNSQDNKGQGQDLIKTFLNKLSKPDIVLNETLKEITPSIKKPSTEQSTNDFTDISDTRNIHEENGKKKDEKNLCEGEDATSSKKDDAISIDETLVNSSDNDNANNYVKTDEKSPTGERTQSKEHVAKKKKIKFTF